MDLVIFDCDGVLVDSEIIANRVVAQELAVRLPGSDVALLLAGLEGFTTAAILERVAAHCGVAFPVGTLAAIEAAVDAALARELTPIPGVLEALRQIPLPKAVASNSPLQRVYRSLECAGLVETFGPWVFSAEMVAEPKPSPALYQHIARHFALAPQRCLVVEDSVPGVTAARAAGMAVIGFVGASHVEADQAQRLYRVGAAKVIADLAELPGLVKRWE
ncbi:MAG TPA: HAD family hydrolase [Candidatus Competibacteraceae bacterium]|nr:HAD family hydrolase [Candidatus Competibacteraceae bacterium]